MNSVGDAVSYVLATDPALGIGDLICGDIKSCHRFEGLCNVLGQAASATANLDAMPGIPSVRFPLGTEIFPVRATERIKLGISPRCRALFSLPLPTSHGKSGSTLPHCFHS